MSYLIRVQLPDEPGSLGALAEAFGLVGGNIRSVDIVETTEDGTVTDDIVIELPANSMADVLITAANSVPGAEVDSIRPFTGRVDRRGQVEMLAAVAKESHNHDAALDRLVSVIPRTMTSSWAIVLDTSGEIHRRAASQAAPEDDGTVPPALDIHEARILNPDTEAWIPDSWSVLESALAAAPLSGTDCVLIIGRFGGPDFLASEVSQLGDVGSIIGGLLRKG